MTPRANHRAPSVNVLHASCISSFTTGAHCEGLLGQFSIRLCFVEPLQGSDSLQLANSSRRCQAAWPPLLSPPSPLLPPRRPLAHPPVQLSRHRPYAAFISHVADSVLQQLCYPATRLPRAPLPSQSHHRSPQCPPQQHICCPTLTQMRPISVVTPMALPTTLQLLKASAIAADGRLMPTSSSMQCTTPTRHPGTCSLSSETYWMS
jgi:hypothetical protein